MRIDRLGRVSKDAAYIDDGEGEGFRRMQKGMARKRPWSLMADLVDLT